MRRKIFIFLVVLGVLTLGVRFFVNQGVPNQGPSGTGVNFVEYAPLTPLGSVTSPLTELQNSVDRVSEAALKGHWTTASRAVEQLQQTWQRLRPNQANQLEIEEGIEKTIQTLHYNVWGKDQQGVLSSAQKLTDLIGQLAS